jgi:hypothetical protein
MILAIQGTKTFKDYNIFMFGMRVALSSMVNVDKQINVYLAGPAAVNSMAQEFFNISENSLKARGIKVKVNKIPPSWISENANDIDFFAYYCLPKEGKSKAVLSAEQVDADVRIFKY